MQRAMGNSSAASGGIQVVGQTAEAVGQARQTFETYLQDLNICEYVNIHLERTSQSGFAGFQIRNDYVNQFAPDGDASRICEILNLDTLKNTSDLEREIVLTMLLCPVPFQFPSTAELLSSIRIRKTVVESARKTSLAFSTNAAERPAEFWSYDDDRGFVLSAGKSLITALLRATQPDESGRRYTFSCRRAAEYICLLAIAIEAKQANPVFYRELHQQAEHRAIKGAEFEEIFLRRIGSLANPLPVRFFVPGDRTWFRNPDCHSSEITGFEGSWTFYLGNGLFADFWRPDRVYDLITKSLSIYHWRHSTYRDADGELQMDEQRVEQLVEATLADPVATKRVLDEILQLQEPMDVFRGGCVEAHREYARQICTGTCDISLPDIHSTAPSSGEMAQELAKS